MCAGGDRGSAVYAIGVEGIDCFGSAFEDLCWFFSLEDLVDIMYEWVESQWYSIGVDSEFRGVIGCPHVVLFWEVVDSHAEAVYVPFVIFFGGDYAVSDCDVRELVLYSYVCDLVFICDFDQRDSPLEFFWDFEVLGCYSDEHSQHVLSFFWWLEFQCCYDLWSIDFVILCEVECFPCSFVQEI